MALPEKVIEQLGREPAQTPGWSFGIIAFSAGILFVSVVAYVTLAFVYEPYLNGQVAREKDQVAQLNQSIPVTDQTKLVTFYSQIANLKTILQNHIFSSQFFAWLEKNTEANTYYQSLGFSSGNQVVLTAIAKTQTDVNQQIALFESAPEVLSASVTSLTATADGGWQFSVTLTMTPKLFLRSSI